ncbi:hypothetical protein Poli38472_000374 [Pythium oligandrum]|uniref:Uricase n=1 Tax=Pythium oligandrum TaxID=41045 RepID=A0A8K1FI17_PYTOL|nr:hypothetical protein Poli38472_000374 [Pythium oligandrum]|eukprot:TMW60332.1 hypothetical protein Poli38472_000374 [Pythium oligandrum]
MVVKLLQHEHGKGRVRLLKVDRQPERHSVIQLEAEILLEGPAESAYYDGDNSGVLPTDSVKNTVYVLAKKHEFETIEDFGIILAKHFVNTHPTKIDVAKVKIFETKWVRLVTPDSKGTRKPHHHAFVGDGSGTATTYVIARKTAHGEPQISVQSGIEGLRVLKTSKSSFVDFFRDAYTTLPDVPDRLVGTVVTATWNYTSEATRVCFQKQADEIKRVLLDTFAGPSDAGVDSPAVQFTLYKMGEAVLDQCPSVKDITITMPNVHNLPVDLTKFGLKNIHPHGEVFLPTDEPHGIIRATMVRATSKL